MSIPARAVKGNLWVSRSNFWIEKDIEGGPVQYQGFADSKQAEAGKSEYCKLLFPSSGVISRRISKSGS